MSGEVMAALTVWKFSSAAGADEALDTLGRLQNQQLIQVQDAAVVNWPAGASKPATHAMRSAKSAGALGGGFWGLLFGLIFFMPLLGLAIGAAGGAILGSMTDVGISETFIAEVRDKVTPGTSALFALTSDAVPDRVGQAFSPTHPELIRTNLSPDQEARLREVFSAET
jgi:uncharacterized membrane protein